MRVESAGKLVVGAREGCSLQGRVYLGTAVVLKVRSLFLRLHIAVAVAINTTARGEVRTWVLSLDHFRYRNLNKIPRSRNDIFMI